MSKNYKLVNFCEFDRFAAESYCAVHGADKNDNLGDINNVDETKLSPFNFICGGSPCFVAGTEILTKEGYKNIEDIKVGDMVMTHKIRYMPVKRIGGEKSKEIWALDIEGFRTLYCTGYHPFYIKESPNSKPIKKPLSKISKDSLFASHVVLPNWRYMSDDGLTWYASKRIEKTTKVADVYNIEVEEDHTYIANGIVTFNCQDFSIAGDQKGSVWTCEDCKFQYNPLTVHYSKRHKCPNCDSENLAKTRSSLLVEWLRIIRHNKPDWGIYENVKNLVGKKFKDTFQMLLNELDEYGYNCHYKVLNAKDYGVPQNRERVYLIFIKKELDNGKFKFPEPFDNGLRLRDMLEDEVDEKFYVNTDKAKQLIQDLIDSGKLDKEYSNSVRGGGQSKPRQTRMGYDTEQVTGLISNQCSRLDKTKDIANSLLARDYKGFGNQATNGVIECINTHKP
jgi:DNA-cytosine methyltransferase